MSKEEHREKLVRTDCETNQTIPEYSVFLSGWIQRRRQIALLHAIRFSHPEHHQHQDGHELWTPRSLHVPCGWSGGPSADAEDVRPLHSRQLQSCPQKGKTQAWIGRTRQACQRLLMINIPRHVIDQLLLSILHV